MNSRTSREAIRETIIDAIQGYNSSSTSHQVQIVDGENTPLYGVSSNLDSLGLISIILKVEELLQIRHGIAVVLADDRAISAKNSPFRSVRDLIDYIESLSES